MISRDDDELLTSAEVAAEFRVDPKTVGNWARAGKINSIRTPGGHRRYRRGEVRELLTPLPTPAAPTDGSEDDRVDRG